MDATAKSPSSTFSQASSPPKLLPMAQKIEGGAPGGEGGLHCCIGGRGAQAPLPPCWIRPWLEHEIKQRSDAYNAARGLKDGEPRATWMADGSQWEGTILVSFLQYCSLLLLFHSYTFLVR